MGVARWLKLIRHRSNEKSKNKNNNNSSNSQVFGLRPQTTATSRKTTATSRTTATLRTTATSRITTTASSRITTTASSRITTADSREPIFSVNYHYKILFILLFLLIRENFNRHNVVFCLLLTRVVEASTKYNASTIGS